MTLVATRAMREAGTRRVTLFYAVFFAGGMPALVYQVAWQRVLTLYFGIDIYSTTVTVATFMLGLGVGSLLGGRLADRVARPGAYYAGLELAMGAFGVVSLPVFAAVGRWFAGSPLAVVVLIDFALLLLPTTLMGMTLPLMCRIVVARDGAIGRHLSWLYGVNTFGAALGALLSAYALVGWFGLDGTTRIAAALNVGLAAAAYVLARTHPASPPAPELTPSAPSRPEAPVLGQHWVLLFSCLSGFIALGYEIVWYRLLTIVLHGTVYVFGTILFFFLAGNAAGSVLARRQVDRGRCVHRFALCQLGIAAYVLLLGTLLGRFTSMPPLRHLTAASFFTTFHPSPELVSGRVDVFSIFSLVDIAIWVLMLLGLPTVLMGYGFTNLLREGAPQVRRLGHSVGAVYFANIAGSCVGSLSVGFVLVHHLGSEGALKVLVLLGASVPMLLTVARRAEAGHRSSRSWRHAYPGVVVMLAVALAFPGKSEIIRALHFADQPGVEFVGAEDRSGVAALRRQERIVAFDQEAAVLGQRRLYIDGSHHGDASESFGGDEAVRLALAAHPAPRRVLAVGLGDGRMASTAATSPEVREVVVVELNGTLAPILRQTQQGRVVLDSPKVTYVVDDGRRWLLAHPDTRFDVIVMFPLHAAHAFSGSLYSIEFFELLAGRLSRGGVVLLQTADMHSTARTLASAFPHVLRMDGSVYLASLVPLRLDPDRLPFPAVDVERRIKADGQVILAATGGARINRDFAPNSEYYITYPYSAGLQTRFANPHGYEAADPGRFRDLMTTAGADDPSHPPPSTGG